MGCNCGRSSNIKYELRSPTGEVLGLYDSRSAASANQQPGDRIVAVLASPA